MPKLTWDVVGERIYETGTSKGVLFVQNALGAYGAGVPWSGLISVTQSPDGGEPTPMYADNIEYLSLTSMENFKGSIEAFTYPDEFAACDGSKEAAPGLFVGQQPRVPFAMAYSTVIGNDTLGEAYGEKIHVIYAAKVAPSERANTTINDTPEAMTISWDFTTTPQQIAAVGVKPSAYVCVDSTKVTAAKFKAIQDLLYGTDVLTSDLPTIDELITLIKAA